MFLINYEKEHIDFAGYNEISSSSPSQKAFASQEGVKNFHRKGKPERFKSYERMSQFNNEHIKDTIFKSLWVGGYTLDNKVHQGLDLISQIFFYKDALRSKIRDIFDGYKELDKETLQYFNVEKEKANQQYQKGINFLRATPRPEFTSLTMEEDGNFLQEEIDITLKPKQDAYPSIESLFKQLTNSEFIIEKEKRKYLRIVKLDYSSINLREFVNYLKIPAFACIILNTMEEITDELNNSSTPFEARIKAYDINNAIHHFKANNPESHKYNHLQTARAIFYNYSDIKNNDPFIYDSIRDSIKRSTT